MIYILIYPIALAFVCLWTFLAGGGLLPDLSGVHAGVEFIAWCLFVISLPLVNKHFLKARIQRISWLPGLSRRLCFWSGMIFGVIMVVCLLVGARVEHANISATWALGFWALCVAAINSIGLGYRRELTGLRLDRPPREVSQ